MREPLGPDPTRASRPAHGEGLREAAIIRRAAAMGVSRWRIEAALGLNERQAGDAHVDLDRQNPGAS
ncbi:MAG: hypothetical protein ACRDLD_07855 [Thermoleophilaceae bacterium]